MWTTINPNISLSAVHVLADSDAVCSFIDFIAHTLALLLQHTTDVSNWSPLQEAKTLLVPFMVSLINLVVPLFYSLFNNFEIYSSQSRQIYVLVIRLETSHRERDKYGAINTMEGKKCFCTPRAFVTQCIPLKSKVSKCSLFECSHQLYPHAAHVPCNTSRVQE